MIKYPQVVASNCRKNMHQSCTSHAPVMHQSCISHAQPETPHPCCNLSILPPWWNLSTVAVNYLSVSFSCSKLVKIKLHETWCSQTSYSMLKQLAASLLYKLLKAMQTHPNSVGVLYLVVLLLADFCLLFTAICSPRSQVTLLGHREQ